MPQADSPIRPPSRSLTMDMDDEEFDGEDAFEIIYPSDLEDTNSLSSGEEEETEDNRKLSCVPSTDHASLIFTKHQSPVFCIGVNPADEDNIITGGQDDRIFVWSSQNGEVFFQSNVFSDSVCYASFSFDGKYFAAGDMSGNIHCWRNNGQGDHPSAWDTKLDDLQWLKWHPQANVLLAGEVAGTIYMWKIPSGLCKVFSGFNSCLTDVGAFMPDGKRAIACYVDGTVRAFNLQLGTHLKYEPTETNHANVISLDVHPDNNIVALGSLASTLMIIKTQGTKSVYHYTCVEEGEKEQEASQVGVECVAFSRNLPYNIVIAATDNGLHIYDYIKNDLRGYIPIEDGVTKLVWPEGSHLVYVGTKVGNIAVCDVRALKRHMNLEGHTTSILDLSLTRGGKTLISASDDNTVRVFQLNEIFSKEDFNPFQAST